MMTLSNPKPGDIWLAYVEFSDYPGIGKVRPVIILDTHEETCIVLAAKVTSKDLTTNGGECIPLLDWQNIGLRKPSYVRLDQKLELAFENLLKDAPIGQVKQTFLKLLVETIKE